MVERTLDLSPDSVAERRRTLFGSRTFVTAAAVVVAGLGTAGPAVASDLPGMPAVPTAPDAPVITIPALPPETIEPPVVVAEIDAENIDVSVSVLSSDEAEAPAEEGASAVVSPDSESDTTASADPAHTGADDDADDAPSVGSNTNVSVRGAIPGTSSGAEQGSTGGGGVVAPAGAAPAAARPSTAPAAATTPDPAQDSEQYHEDNSQYQSDAQIATEPWNWTWTLTIDCLGNPVSSSVESGDQESLEWVWEWAWEWGCPDAETPAGESAAQKDSAAPERAPPGATPAAQQTPDTRAAAAPSASSATAPSGEPWSWTWTFTFCGTTETFTTQAGTGTPLTWTWDWTWNWSCGSAPADSGAASVTVPEPAQPSAAIVPDPIAAVSSPAAGAPTETDAIQIPAMTFTVGPYGFDTATAGEALDLPPAPTLPTEIVVEVAIPPAIPPSPAAPAVPLQDLPFPPGAAPLELGPHAAPPRAVLGQAPTTSRVSARPPALLPPAATAVAGRAATAREARPEKEQRAHVTRARPDSRPALPLAPRPRHGAGSTSASSAASSALLVGIVALAGFVLIAAPGRGRRLEVARELSPRGLDRSPIDHPG